MSQASGTAEPGGRSRPPQATGPTCRLAGVAFLIHVMGEETPRSIVFESEETARHEAARLGIDRRCYTLVKQDGPASADSPPR